jgi:hypothetical protein
MADAGGAVLRAHASHNTSYLSSLSFVADNVEIRQRLERQDTATHVPHEQGQKAGDSLSLTPATNSAEAQKMQRAGTSSTHNYIEFLLQPPYILVEKAVSSISNTNHLAAFSRTSDRLESSTS